MTLKLPHRPTGKPPATLLLEAEVAARWRLSERTLQRWRGSGKGPVFLRIGKRIVYKVDDVEAFEAGARQGDGASE